MKKGMLGRTGLLLCMLLILTAVVSAAERYWPAAPASDIYVTDKAGMLSEGDRSAILAAGAALDKKYGAQLVVVTVESLDGHDLNMYATDLYRDWGIGDKQKNNGALLLIAKQDRKFRIEVGYGLEGALTDGWCGEVLDGMKERFRAENYSPAICEAYAKLTKKVYESYGASPDEALGALEAAGEQGKNNTAAENEDLTLDDYIMTAEVVGGLWLALELLWFILRLLCDIVGFFIGWHPHYRAFKNTLTLQLWDCIINSDGYGGDFPVRHHRSGGGFGGGGSSGGGFGGGRSGGGGASGGW